MIERGRERGRGRGRGKGRGRGRGREREREGKGEENVEKGFKERGLPFHNMYALAFAKHPKYLTFQALQVEY